MLSYTVPDHQGSAALALPALLSTSHLDRPAKERLSEHRAQRMIDLAPRVHVRLGLTLPAACQCSGFPWSTHLRPQRKKVVAGQPLQRALDSSVARNERQAKR